MKNVIALVLSCVVAIAAVVTFTGCSGNTSPSPEVSGTDSSQANMSAEELEASLLEISKKVQDLALQYTQLGEKVTQENQEAYDQLAQTISDALTKVSNFITEKNVTINDLNLLNDSIAEIQRVMDTFQN